MGRKKKYITEEERKKAQVAATLKWRAKHPEQHRTYQAKYRKENPDRIRVLNQKQYYKDHERTLAWHKNSRQEAKADVIAAYGERCQCCGDEHSEFLSIDHTHGYAKSKELYAGIPRASAALYKWLRANGFPKENFRLLCFNCNLSHGHFGYCPHENEKEYGISVAC